MITAGIVVLCGLALVVVSIPVYLFWDMNYNQAAPDELEENSNQN